MEFKKKIFSLVTIALTIGIGYANAAEKITVVRYMKKKVSMDR